MLYLQLLHVGKIFDALPNSFVGVGCVCNHLNTESIKDENDNNIKFGSLIPINPPNHFHFFSEVDAILIAVGEKTYDPTRKPYFHTSET